MKQIAYEMTFTNFGEVNSLQLAKWLSSNPIITDENVAEQSFITSNGEFLSWPHVLGEG